jgi:hypothetical protein
VTGPKAIIFVGPSLPPRYRRDGESFVWAPPVRRGDLKTCSEYNVIVILDGEFGQSLSVSPKEIMAAIADGKDVVGASSMGALRASELDGEGMQGIGWVYDWLSRPGVRRDDDVALAYSPLDLSAFTVPMVNIEYFLRLPRTAAVVTAGERHRVARQCRRIFYAERTPERVEGVLRNELGAERSRALYDSFGGELPDIKRTDALTALDLVRTVGSAPRNALATIVEANST